MTREQQAAIECPGCGVAGTQVARETTAEEKASVRRKVDAVFDSGPAGARPFVSHTFRCSGCGHDLEVTRPISADVRVVFPQAEA